MKFLILSVLLMLGACRAGSPDETPAAASSESREETRGIRNTEAIGLPGDAMADRVDQALDAQQQHQKQIEQGMPE